MTDSHGMSLNRKRVIDIQANVEIRGKPERYSDCLYWQEWALVQE